MQCYRGSCLFPSTATTFLEHEHMGWHKGLPSLGTPALTFSRSRRKWPLRLSAGVPISTQHWHQVGCCTADSPRLICLLPLGDALRWPGLFHTTLSCNGGERKENDTVLGIRIIQLCQLIPYGCDSLASANTIPSQIWELPFFRGEASGGMPRRNKTACQSQPHWKSWFYSLLHNQLWVAPYAICY